MPTVDESSDSHCVAGPRPRQVHDRARTSRTGLKATRSPRLGRPPHPSPAWARSVTTSSSCCWHTPPQVCHTRSPEDIQTAILDDDFTPFTLIQLEELGFGKGGKGEVKDFIADGAIEVGGGVCRSIPTADSSARPTSTG